MRTAPFAIALLSIAMLLVADIATTAAVVLPQPDGAMATVGFGLSDVVCAGGVCGNDIGSIVFAAMSGLRILVDIVAVLIIIITGFILVTAQDENQLTVSRRTLFAAIMALILVNLVEPIRNTFITGFGTATGGSAGATILSQEVIGIIDFIEVPLMTVAMLMIIISGIRAIATLGTDQGVTHIRRTVFSVSAGIILIVAKLAITRSIGSTAEDVSGIATGSNNAQGLVDTVIDVTGKVVAFMALAGVTVIVIAGIIMVINKGDQEVATRSRNMIIRVVLGLVVILVSYGLAFVFTQVAAGF
jgi:hypothetical protein